MYDIFRRVEAGHWWFQARRDIVLRLIAPMVNRGRPVRILDIGCGTGFMMRELERFGEVYGMDTDEKALAYATRTIGTPAKVLRGSLPDELPREERFSLVTLLDVLEHVEKDVDALRAIRENILEADGVLLLTVPAYQFLWSSHDCINQHKRRYTKRELAGKLRMAGYHIVKISYFNTFLFPFALVLNFGSKLFGGDHVQSPIAWLPPRWLNFLLYKIFSFEQLLLPKVNLPFGVSLVGIARTQVLQ